MITATDLLVEADSKNVQDAPAIRVGFVMHVMQVAGAEVLVAEIIRRLGSRIQPTIFCLDGIGTLGEQLQQQGIEVVCLNRQPGFDRQVAFRFAREIRKRNMGAPLEAQRA